MIKKDDVVYISGPMSGIKEENKPEFNKMEEDLRNIFGCVVLSPARHPAGLEYETYMEYAMIDVDEADIIILLDNWEKSPGAAREINRALDTGKKILKPNQLIKGENNE